MSTEATETGALRFGFIGGPPVGDELDRWGRHTEALGASFLGTGEGAAIFEDPYIWLASLARVTTRALLGTVLSVPGLRDPIVHANTMATIQRLSAGRAVLGLGVGDLARLDVGLAPTTVATLVEYARIVRALTAGEAVDFEGRSLQVRWADNAVPVWLGADGPKVQRAAGAMADGIVVGQAGHPSIVRQVLDNVAAGARDAARPPSDVEVWLTCRIVVTDRPNGAIYLDGLDEYGARQARYFWRTSGSPSADEVVARIEQRKGVRLDDGVATRLVAYNEEFDRWQAWSHGDKTNVELLEKHGLREWAGRMFYISGPVDECAERVQGLVDAGARNFLVPAITGERFGAAEGVAAVFDRL
jgi:alkanesulfonate monooxygenase SsuD/methylene tetrahydromethanopterin reductase-like flavin-dependent oxidoreductase (luciferase family)